MGRDPGSMLLMVLWAMGQATGGGSPTPTPTSSIGEPVGDLLKLAETIPNLGIAAVIFLGFGVFVLGLIKEWIVMGPTHKDVRNQRDRLLDLSLKQAEIAQNALAKAGGRAPKQRPED